MVEPQTGSGDPLQDQPETDAQPADPAPAAEEQLADDGMLTVSAEDLELPAPTLEEPQISSDVAEEASLPEVSAETEAVQREAQQVGTLAGGKSPQSPRDKEAVARKIEEAASRARAAVDDEQAP